MFNVAVPTYLLIIVTIIFSVTVEILAYIVKYYTHVMYLLVQ